jgi:hypothetical protein
LVVQLVDRLLVADSRTVVANAVYWILSAVADTILGFAFFIILVVRYPVHVGLLTIGGVGMAAVLLRYPLLLFFVPIVTACIFATVDCAWIAPGDMWLLFVI